MFERSRYPWYPYINNILHGHSRTSKREREAMEAAIKAANPEAQELVRLVYISGAKDLHGAAEKVHVSYQTAWRRIHEVKLDIARRLGLLDE